MRVVESTTRFGRKRTDIYPFAESGDNLSSLVVRCITVHETGEISSNIHLGRVRHNEIPALIVALHLVSNLAAGTNATDGDADHAAAARG